MIIKNYIHGKVNNFIEEFNIRQFMQDKDYPVHFLIPSIMKQHIQEWKEVLEEKYDLDYSIYFAKKANPSVVFSRKALEQGIKIDVASANELSHVLQIGFDPKNIECTGPKDDKFLALAVGYNTLISCDSVNELQRVIELKKENDNVDILLRISDPHVGYGNVRLKDSRFGILRKDLPKCFEMIKDAQGINLKGFHIHRSETQPQLKAEFLIEMITQILKARELGMYPNCINMGGAFGPLHHAQNLSEWHNYLNKICDALRENKPSGNWRSNFYDLTLVENQVKGLNILKQKIYSGMFSKKYILEILDYGYAGTTIGHFLEEADITLLMEPGYNLLEQAGLTAIKIIDVKKYNGSYLVTCSANCSNLSSTFFESLTDPIFLSANERFKEDPANIYIFGNTCSEDDIIMRRPVTIPKIPEVGDILLFLNTGAYKSYFQDANPIMQQKGRFFKVEHNGEWEVSRSNDN